MRNEACVEERPYRSDDTVNHPIEVTYWRNGDKTPFRTMDPALARQSIVR